MIVVYVAGPYRASNSWLIEQNVRRAETIALQLWRYGFVGVDPHALTRFYQGTLPDAVWLAGDLELISRFDAVLLIDGWKESAGSVAERDYAIDKGIPVFESVEALLVWATDQDAAARSPEAAAG